MSLDVYLYNNELFEVCLYSGNITHNLSPMAREAGIYLALWRPEEMLDPVTAMVLHDSEESKGYHHTDTLALRAQLPIAHACDLTIPLRQGLMKLLANPEHYKKFDAQNRFGTYEGFVPFVKEYLEACEANLDAIVKVSR